MEFIDENGRLFGRVNIIDALVVLFAVAVLVAGAALIFGEDPEPEMEEQEPEEPTEATMYVTLLAGGDAATAFEQGPVDLNDEHGAITDIHRTIGPQTFFRVELVGIDDDGFRFAGGRVRLDDTYTVVSNTTQSNARVVERDVGPEFEMRTEQVTVETTVRTSIAEQVAAGDEQRVGGTTVATVQSVDATAANESHTAIEVELALETRVVDDVARYGGDPVRLGRTLRLETNDYEFEADIVRRE